MAFINIVGPLERWRTTVMITLGNERHFSVRQTVAENMCVSLETVVLGMCWNLYENLNSPCSARFYGAGKQWAVCTHYSSKHTPIHTSGNVLEHMDFTSCSAIITQTVKNKTQTTEERAEQM
ncbi:hypothetical protein PO909_019762 [Leuciscus waleckii]